MYEHVETGCKHIPPSDTTTTIPIRILFEQTSHHTRTRLKSHRTASVRYQLLTVSPFKSLPSYLPPTVLKIRRQINVFHP